MLLLPSSFCCSVSPILYYCSYFVNAFVRIFLYFYNVLHFSVFVLDISENTVRIILHYTNTYTAALFLTVCLFSVIHFSINEHLLSDLRYSGAVLHHKKKVYPPYRKKMGFFVFGLLGVLSMTRESFCIFACAYWKDNYPRDIKSRGKQLFYFDFCVWQAVPTGESRQQQAALLPFHRRQKYKKASLMLVFLYWFFLWFF